MNSHLSINDWADLGNKLFISELNLEAFVIDHGNQNADPQDTIFFIHGFPESSFSYSKTFPFFKERFKRIIYFDFIGFGFSSKPTNYEYSIFNKADLFSLIWKKLNLKGAHLLSHDMGDSVLLEILYRQGCNLLPDYINNNILSATFTNGNMLLELAKLRIGQSLLLSPIGPFFNKFSNYSIFKNQIYSADGSNKLVENDVEALWKLLKYNDGHLIMHHLIKYYKDREKYQNTRWLKNIDIYKDMLINIAWGKKDAVAPVEVALKLKKEIFKQANLILIDGVGHFGQISSPKEWSESVLKFYI